MSDEANDPIKTVKDTLPAPISSNTPGAGEDLLQAGIMRQPDQPGMLGKIGRFDVIKHLGQGGMGQVLLAREPVTNVKVAIKVLKPQFARDNTSVHRFLTEARHAYAMSHPNILKVLEVSGSEERPFYVVPYIEGGSLARRIGPQKPMPTETTLAIAQQIASALSYAHGRGIIHRDLKPANVLVDGEGRAYLTDFGLLRTVFNDSFVDVQQSSLEGTAPYMSPAVVEGKAEDTRCDIYSFGAMLYEMLTGQPPYTGPSIEIILKKISAGPPEPLLKLNPKASKELAAIADWAMARELRDRYATMADVLADLEKIANGNAPVGPRGAVGLSKPTRRNFAIAGTAVVVVAMVALAAWPLVPRSERLGTQSLPQSLDLPSQPQPGPSRPMRVVPPPTQSGATRLAIPEAPVAPNLTARHPAESPQARLAKMQAMFKGKVTLRPDGRFEFFYDFSDPAQLDDWIIREPQSEWAVEGGWLVCKKNASDGGSDTRLYHKALFAGTNREMSYDAQGSDALASGLFAEVEDWRVGHNFRLTEHGGPADISGLQVATITNMGALDPKHTYHVEAVITNSSASLTLDGTMILKGPVLKVNVPSGQMAYLKLAYTPGGYDNVRVIGALDPAQYQFLFQEYFEVLSRWTGRDGGRHSGVIVPDPLSTGRGNVLTFTNLSQAGDIFTRQAFPTTGYLEIRFDYLGLPKPESISGDLGGFFGFCSSLAGKFPSPADSFFAATKGNYGPVHLLDNGDWHRVTHRFRAEGMPPLHLVIEDFLESRGVAGDVYFDNITVKLMAGPITVPVIAGPVTNPANGHLYYLLSEETWQNSEVQAVELGGHLVTINDKAEQEWVFSTFGSFGRTNRSLWIGLREVDVSKNHQWVSGEPTTYTRWNRNQPSGGIESFVHMIKIGNGYGHPPGEWNDLPSPLAAPYPEFDPICGVVEVVPSAKPVMSPGPAAAEAVQPEPKTFRRLRPDQSRNLIANGSFELGPFVPDQRGEHVLLPGSTQLVGWNVIENHIFRHVDNTGRDIGDTNSYVSLSLKGYSAIPPFGGVTQSIATEIGKTYRLSLDLCMWNDHGERSLPGANSVLVRAGSQEMSFTNRTSEKGIAVWRTYSFAFVAQSFKTPISILGQSAKDVLIVDNVSVEPLAEGAGTD